MTDTTGSGLPWTGDEREQAHYPRSQFWLHLRPARVTIDPVTSGLAAEGIL